MVVMPDAMPHEEPPPIVARLCEHSDRPRTRDLFSGGISWKLCDQCWYAALNLARVNLLVAREKSKEARG